MDRGTSIIVSVFFVVIIYGLTALNMKGEVVDMFRWIFKKNEVDTQPTSKRLNDEEFDALIESYKQTNKEMRESCVEILCANAYISGKGGIEMNFDDMYEGYSDVEILQIKTEYLMGKLDRTTCKVDDTKNELKEVREGVTK